jgi:hypothetical protein
MRCRGAEKLGISLTGHGLSGLSKSLWEVTFNGKSHLIGMDKALGMVKQ